MIENETCCVVYPNFTRSVSLWGLCLRSENSVRLGFMSAAQPGSQNHLASIIFGEQFTIGGQPLLLTARNKTRPRFPRLGRIISLIHLPQTRPTTALSTSSLRLFLTGMLQNYRHHSSRNKDSHTDGLHN